MPRRNETVDMAMLPPDKGKAKLVAEELL